MSKNRRGNAPQSAASGLILYGRHAVFAALANPERNIGKILTTRENFDELKAHCQKHNIDPAKIQIVDRSDINKILPADAVHQGYALYCAPLPGYAIEEICALADRQDNCTVLVLDQVTDPQNIGAIIRSCAAFGALALILQDKNSPAETAAMAKASAGTIDILPICRVTNLSRAIDQLKTAGFWTIGMDGYAKDTIDKINKAGKNAIIMGSEGKGMRRLVEEGCDITVRLPIDPRVESLNVSTAAAIALYEMKRS